jgi:hypothetical protein
MPKPTKKKILANVWEPSILRLSEKTRGACLQRDAYLDRVFRHEAKMLDKEIEAPKSKEAKTELAKHLASIQRKQVNFALSPETVETMNDVCERNNVPRDSFINRVLLFLVAKQPRLFERLLDIDAGWYWTQRVLDGYAYEPPLMPWHLDGSLQVLQDLVDEDPFWAIRACIDAARHDEQGSCELLHQAWIAKDFLKTKFPIESALGFNCRFPDDQIEDHPAWLERQLELERQVEEFMADL